MRGTQGLSKLKLKSSQAKLSRVLGNVNSLVQHWTVSVCPVESTELQHGCPSSRTQGLSTHTANSQATRGENKRAHP